MKVVVKAEEQYPSTCSAHQPIMKCVKHFEPFLTSKSFWGYLMYICGPGSYS